MMRNIAYLLTVFLLYSNFAYTIFAQKTEDFVYETKGKRDPFIPLITKKARFAGGLLEDAQTIDDVALEGIVWDPQGGSVAILNGVIIREKEEMGNVRIEKIDEKGIIISINEVEYKLDLIEKGDEEGEEE